MIALYFASGIMVGVISVLVIAHIGVYLEEGKKKEMEHEWEELELKIEHEWEELTRIDRRNPPKLTVVKNDE